MIARKPGVRPSHFDRLRGHVRQAAQLYARAVDHTVEHGIIPGEHDALAAFEEKLLRAALEFATVAHDTEHSKGAPLQ